MEEVPLNMTSKRILIMGTTLKSVTLLLVASFYSLMVAAEDTSEAMRLVVIYDRWVDFSPSTRRQEDIHAKATFMTVASSYGIQVEYIQIPFEELFLHKLWRSRSIAGVVSVGECPQGTAVLTLARRTGLPALALDNENCARPGDNSSTLPIYRVKIHRRYQCVSHVMNQWITSGSRPANPTPSFRSPLLPQRTPPTGREDYHQEYLNCVGPDLLLDVDEIDPDNAPPDMKLELGRRYLNGRQLTIVTIDRPPFVKLTMSDGEIIAAKGFCYEMLNEMVRRFNFTYKLVLPYDGNWGAPMDNGTFNGMVGMVHRHEVDMAIAGITITYIRETVIDFTHAFYEEPTTILIPPPTEKHDFLAFLSPFPWQVWFSTLVSILIVGSLTWFLATAGNLPYLYPHNHRNVSYTWFRYVWDCAFSLVSQGNRMRQTQPARLMNGVWWTFSVIIIYTYTGTLIAFLTVPNVSSLIESLEELANQRDVLWTYRPKTAHDSLFSTAPAPGTYNKIGQLLREKPNLFVNTDDEGVAAVLRGNTAFIKEKSWLDFAMERDFIATQECRLFQVNQLFFSAGFGWALQEESIFLPLVNAEILRMMQSGLFTIWRQKYWPKPNKCTSSKGVTSSGPRPLHLGNFVGHFFLLGVGVSLAVTVLIIERIYQSKLTEKQAKMDDNVKEERSSSERYTITSAADRKGQPT